MIFKTFSVTLFTVFTLLYKTDLFSTKPYEVILPVIVELITTNRKLISEIFVLLANLQS